MPLSRTEYLNPLRERYDDAFFRALPRNPGVYFFLGEDGEPLYIGKADCLKKRLMSYRLARPGTVPDHTLEMLEMAVTIRWELHPTGKDALRRESDLLRSIRPPFNIAGTDAIEYLMLGLKHPRGMRSLPGNVRVEFRLSHRELPPEFSVFGRFQHRGKTKAGYTALLRLFFASVYAKERFIYYPARISAPSPPYLYSGDVPALWLGPLSKFLHGESEGLLKLITLRLLEKPDIPPYLYARIGHDLATSREFFRTGPRLTRRIAAEAGLGRGKPVTRELMDKAFTTHWGGGAQSYSSFTALSASGSLPKK